eukprot:6235524-Prymnesium_polylepis.1
MRRECARRGVAGDSTHSTTCPVCVHVFAATGRMRGSAFGSPGRRARVQSFGPALDHLEHTLSLLAGPGCSPLTIGIILSTTIVLFAPLTMGTIYGNFEGSLGLGGVRVGWVAACG